MGLGLGLRYDGGCGYQVPMVQGRYASVARHVCGWYRAIWGLSCGGFLFPFLLWRRRKSACDDFLLSRLYPFEKEIQVKAYLRWWM